MRREMLLPLALLFIAHGVPSSAQSEGAAPATEAPAGERFAPLLYDVGHPFVLNCTAPRSDPSVAYVWKINGTALAEAQTKGERFKLEEGGSVLRTSGRTYEDDYGNYTCASDAALQGWEVRGRPHAKLQPHINVVEGQKLKIVCKVVGKPYPAVTWTFRNSSDNGTELGAALGGRARLERSEQGVEGGVLLLDAAERADEGVFMCTPDGGLNATTHVYVKGMYAALWPFLGICAEVFVLCAIILVYEKRRTKPELDDSDTDNHEQKKS